MPSNLNLKPFGKAVASITLIDLHWLPLHFHPSFRICSFMYKISHSTSSFYFSNFSLPPKRAGLCSSTRSWLFIISRSQSYGKTFFLVHFSGTLFLQISNLFPILFFFKYENSPLQAVHSIAPLNNS